jgi:hypothetical protein
MQKLIPKKLMHINLDRNKASISEMQNIVCYLLGIRSQKFLLRENISYAENIGKVVIKCNECVDK